MESVTLVFHVATDHSTVWLHNDASAASVLSRADDILYILYYWNDCYTFFYVTHLWVDTIYTVLPSVSFMTAAKWRTITYNKTQNK